MRIKTIIQTGRFWCSKFSALNDPMEGVFNVENKKEVERIFSGKNKYKICSFSDENALKNVLMWGHYANGFKGVAIEVEVDDYLCKEVNYKEQIPGGNGSLNVEDILTCKKKDWDYEFEYRRLFKKADNTCDGENKKIGQITKVYFGTPYSGLENTDIIIKNDKYLQKYYCLKEELKAECKKHNIECKDYKLS